MQKLERENLFKGREGFNFFSVETGAPKRRRGSQIRVFRKLASLYRRGKCFIFSLEQGTEVLIFQIYTRI